MTEKPPDRKPDLYLHVDRYYTEDGGVKDWIWLEPEDDTANGERWARLMMDMFKCMVEAGLIEDDSAVLEVMKNDLEKIGVPLADAIEEIFGVSVIDLGLPDGFDSENMT